jgi:hypothetical protein
MKKTRKKSNSKPKLSGRIKAKLITREQKELRRKLVDTEMLLANAEHNYKVAQGYIGELFSKTYVEKKYGEELARSQRRLLRLQKRNQGR